MVDNTKFNIANVGEQVLQVKGWRLFRAKTNQYKITWKMGLHNKKAKFEGKFKLFVMLEYNRKTQAYNLIVQGSIRKWFFGKNLRRDLTRTELIICLIYLSQELNVPFSEMMNANITKSELGLTLALSPKYRKLLQGLIFYKRLGRHTKEETLYFGDKAINCYTLIFYDKLLEIHKNNPQKIKHLHDKIFFCRFEICIHKITRVNVYDYKNKAKTFNQILENWEDIQTEICNTVERILHIDYASNFNVPEQRTHKSITEELRYKYIQLKTLPFLFEKEKINTTHKRTAIKKWIENRNTGEYKELKLGFAQKLEQKLQRLSK